SRSSKMDPTAPRPDRTPRVALAPFESCATLRRDVWSARSSADIHSPLDRVDRPERRNTSTVHHFTACAFAKRRGGQKLEALGVLLEHRLYHARPQHLEQAGDLLVQQGAIDGVESR